MANQVASMQTFGNFGLDVLSPNVHSGFMPTGVLPNVGVQSSGALPNDCIQSDIALQNHVGHSFGGSYVQASPQVPLSQAQCEQFLNFLKNYMASGSGNDAQIAHQAASIMAPYPSIPQPSLSTSSSPSCPSNFSGNPYWISPNLSHSIFAAQVVDRHAYKSNTWIIDIGATNHMVHSVA